MAETTELPDHTSIRERITGGLNLAEAIAETIEEQPLWRFGLKRQFTDDLGVGELSKLSPQFHHSTI